MRRVALILATFGILCFTAGQLQANPYHPGHYRHHGWYAPVVVRAPIVIPPRVVVARPFPPPAPPVYSYDYCEPWPTSGFYYQGRGVSVRVGF